MDFFLSFFMAKQYSIVNLLNIFFIQASEDGHLGWSLVLAKATWAATSMLAQIVLPYANLVLFG